MITYLRIPLAFLLITLLNLGVAFGGPEEVTQIEEDAKWAETLGITKKFSDKVGRRIDRTHPRFKLRMTPLELTTGNLSIGLGLGYRYYVNKFNFGKGDRFFREDAYQLRLPILDYSEALDKAEEVTATVGLKAEVEVSFTRLHGTGKEARWRWPKSIWSLPYTAEVIKEKMQTGDLVRIPMVVLTRLRVDQNTVIGSGVELKAGVEYLVQGRVMAQIYKISDDPENTVVNVQFSEVGNRHFALNFSLGYGVEIFSADLTHRLLKLSYIPKDVKKLFHANYNFNLSNPKAADLYNRIMAPQARPWTFKGRTFLIPNLRNVKDAADQWFKALKEGSHYQVTDLANVREMSADPSNGITYGFHGFIDSQAPRFDSKISLALMSRRHHLSFTENQIVVQNPDGTEEYYLYPVRRKGDGFRFDLGSWAGEEESISRAYILVESDQAVNPDRKKREGINLTFKQLGARYFMDDINYQGKEQIFTFKALKRTLSHAIYDMLTEATQLARLWGWPKSSEEEIVKANLAKRPNASASWHIFINEEGYKRLNRLSTDQIMLAGDQFYEKYQPRGPLPSKIVDTSGKLPIVGPLVIKPTVGRVFGSVNEWRRFIRDLAKSIAHDSELTSEFERYENFYKLRHNHYFKNYTLGFLIDTLGRSNLPSSVAVKYDMESDRVNDQGEDDRIEYKYNEALMDRHKALVDFLDGVIESNEKESSLTETYRFLQQ